MRELFTLSQLNSLAPFAEGESVYVYNDVYKNGIEINIDKNWRNWGGAEEKWWTSTPIGTSHRKFEDVFGVSRVNEEEPEVTEAAFIPRLYVIMRRDIYDMNEGKAIAQGGHAVSEFISYMERRRNASSSESRSLAVEAYEEWLNQSSQGSFGTKITLWATRAQIAELKEGTVSQIVDDTYPYTNTWGERYTNSEVTCWYKFAFTKEQADELSAFEMHP